MSKKQKNPSDMNEDEAYIEAQRRINKCRSKNGKALSFSKLTNLREIPPEFEELKNLKELDLSSTKLKKIPGFIGNLSSLEELVIGPYFSADKRDDIMLPPELGNLHSLRGLFLGYGIPEIPEWVWSLANLESLSINNDDIKTIPAAISNLKKLHMLQIDGKGITALPGEIGDIPELFYLALNCPCLRFLPETLANLKEMMCLFMVSCNLAAIPDFVYGWTELKLIWISMAYSCQEPEIALKNIYEKIGNMKHLTFLRLINASITQIPESLGNCPLTFLELSGTFNSLPETIGNISKLETLKLYSKELQALPDSVWNLSALNELEINAHKMRSLPESIGGCRNLKSVSVKSDKLSSLPESFCGLENLEKLSLETFALKALPYGFGDLKALKELDILSGALTELPESMGSLKNLKSLRLDVHNVTKLPDSFRNLSYIKNVLIDNNQRESELICNKVNKKKGIPRFNEMTAMSHRYRQKLIETYSIKQIETLLCSAPRYCRASEKDKELFRQIMNARYHRLNRKFK